MRFAKARNFGESCKQVNREPRNASSVAGRAVRCSYTKEQFIREAKEEFAKDPDVIDRVMKHSSPEKRLEGLSPEEILQGMSPQVLAEIQRRLQGGK